YFSSPVAYVLLAAYLALAGYFFFALLSAFNQTLQMYSMMRNPEMLSRFNLNQMVVVPLLHNMSVLLIFIVPAISMRMFPEEKRSGTYELLLTSPVRVGEIVLGKFLGGLVLVLLMVALSGLFGILLVSYGNPEVPMMLSGYLGLALMATVFLAVAALISSFTDDVVIAYDGPLFGLLALLFLAFGFVGTLVIDRPLSDWYVLGNLGLGACLLIAYLSFGFEEFRSLLGQRSTRYGAGALVYTLLFVLLVVGGNYISARRHHRWDLTEAGICTLAPQSKKVVEALKEDLAMTGFVEGGQDPQLQSLLESYQYAAPGHVKVRIVDPDKEPALVEQMKITTAPSVNLQYGKESFVVTKPAEEAITNGIIRVAGTTRKLVYFAERDGEADIANQDDPKGYAGAKLALEQENYEVKPLVLPSAEQIPDDASALVIAGVQRPLSEHEVHILDAYLK